MTSAMRIAVLGAGRMGGNHIRVLTEMPEVELVAVAEPNPERAEFISRRFPVKIYNDPLALLDNETLEAVTICVPTSQHHPVVLAALNQGIHVLVEKPISFSVAEGQDMVQAAADAGLVFTVGHVERFNPAVGALRQRILDGELGQVFQIATHRASPFPAHIADVGVVLDLAVHDLDVMRYVTGSEVTRIYAEIAQRVHNTQEDQLVGLLRFANHTIGKVMVNWLTPTKIRQLFVVGERGMFEVNYLTQDLFFYENAAVTNPEWETIQVLRGVSEGPMTRHVVRKKEPLRVELEAFIEAITSNKPPMVSGEDALMALWLAQTVVQAGQENRAITITDLPIK